MRRYIYHRPLQMEVVPNTEGTDLIERGNTLLQLLSDRDVLRIICAPSLYGKSVLAFQYAQIAFPMGNITWVNASDPRFLCSLDAGVILEHLDSAGKGGLVIFDEVDELSEARALALAVIIDSLQSKHTEVVLTTSYRSLAEELPFSSVLVDARDLMVTADELAVHDRRKGTQHPTLAKPEPAVFLDLRFGMERFVSSQVARMPQTPEEALALLALIAGKGRTAALCSLISTACAPCLEQVARAYPHAGVSTHDARFEAIELSEEQRLMLLSAHLDELLAFSPYDDEHDFISAFCEAVLSEANRSFALSVTSTFLGEVAVDLAEVSALTFESESLALMESDYSELPATMVHPARTWFCPDPSGDSLIIRMLGNFDVYCDGKRLPEKGEIRNKAKILLALMVVNHGKDLPLPWVERTLWPDVDQERARMSFYNLWSYMRRLFSSETEHMVCLQRTRDTVSLRGVKLESDVLMLEGLLERVKDCVDAIECERILTYIMRLYHGPFLPGVCNPQVESYRTTFMNKVLDAMVDGATFLGDRGETKLAQHFAAFAFEIDPSREDVCYLYMSTQKRLGQFAGAISTFMMCRRALVERFGIDGSKRLDALYEEILNEVS